MVKIGDINVLRVARFVDFGAYLEAGNDVEILLPKRYIPDGINEGDEIEVFIYNDSEDRLIATTEMPKAKVGDFAFLQVRQVNDTGAFLDWGLMKDLLVPFREQKVRMQPKRWYVVYVYLDDNSKRIVASAKLDKFLGNRLTNFQRGEVVEALITKRTELGYKCIVNGVEWGMLYHNEVFSELNIGERHTARIKRVRRDGKIDLIIGGTNKDRTSEVAEHILTLLKQNRKRIAFSDKSSPEEIQVNFSCSKKDFKKALGMLYKQGLIELDDNFTILK